MKACVLLLLAVCGCDRAPFSYCEEVPAAVVDAELRHLEPCIGPVSLPSAWSVCIVPQAADSGAWRCNVPHPDCPNGFCRYCGGATYPDIKLIRVAPDLGSLRHELGHAVTGDRDHEGPVWRCVR